MTRRAVAREKFKPAASGNCEMVTLCGGRWHASSVANQGGRGRIATSLPAGHISREAPSVNILRCPRTGPNLPARYFACELWSSSTEPAGIGTNCYPACTEASHTTQLLRY